MSKKQDLLEYFTQLTPEEILRLPTQRKNELLVMLHAEVSQNGPWNERMHKTKMIAKSRKVSYKAFVRRRMPMIMSKLALRVSGSEKEGEATQAEGKSIFKSALGEVQRRKVENFHAHFKEIKSQENRDELICPICLELLMSPVLTSCGHAFCYECLDSSINFSNLCPSCRENIKGSDVIVCPLLESYVRRTVQFSLPKHYPSYCERTRKMQEWRGRREVELRQIRLGSLLDVRDTENIWCQGTVLDIFYEGEDKECPSAILVHFNRWHKIYNEIIELPNSRIAKLSCFTGRTDIPRYNLSQEDNNMRGLVVTGTPVVQNADSDSQSDEPVPDLVPIMVRPQPQANDNNSATIINIVMQNWAARLFRVPHPDFIEANEDHNSQEASYMEIQEQQPDENQEQSIDLGQSQEDGYNNNNQQEQEE